MFRLQAELHTLWMRAEGVAPAAHPGGGPMGRTIPGVQGSPAGRAQLVGLPGSRGRLAPDAWERAVLARAGGGGNEFHETLRAEDGRPVLRYFGGLRMEAGCSGCHGGGVPTGGLLGGISLSMPLKTAGELLVDPGRRWVLAAFLAGWALVLAALAFARQRQRQADLAEHAAARSVRDGEDRLREAQRIAQMGVWEHNHRNGQIHWSEETYRIFGLAPDAVPPTFDVFMERVHPEDRVRVADHFQRHLSTGEPYQLEYRLLREDGEERHILVSCHTEFDGSGLPLRTFGINLDLTERKRLDAALKSEAEAHRTLLETSLDGCLELDNEGRIVNVNEAYLRMTGYLREGLLGTSARRLQDVEDSGAFMALTTHLRRKGMDRFETWHVGQDGRRIPLQASVTFLPEQGRLLYFFRDLSAERAARQALAASEAKFANAFRLSPDAMLIVELAEGRIQELNDGFARLSGWSREEALGRSSVELGLWPDGPTRQALTGAVMQKGEAGPLRAPFQRRGGHPWIGEVHAVRIGQEEPPKALVVIRDVTELDHAERALRASEARFRILFDQSALGLAHVDVDGTILLANARLAAFFRMGERELQARTFGELLREAGVAAASAPDQTVVRQELKVRRPDGSHGWGRRTSTPIQGPDGSPAGTLETIEDTTELQERQEVAREAEAVVAKGQMAAYVAHEINGPLAGIKSAMELISGAVPEEHPRRGYVDLVRREVERIAGIVRSLYEVHRIHPPEAQDVEVAAVLQDVATLMAPRFRAQGVRLEFESSEPGLRVTLRADLLRQVLFNLLLNALEASPPGTQVHCAARQVGHDLEVRIADQGQGIAPEIAERVWEPGFTTKRSALQGGLGLGLATTRRLLESIQGSIRFDSPPGQGTTFTVRVPVQNSSAAAGGPTRDRTETP